MNKYKIEGAIDFFSELYKSLDNEVDTNIDDSNLCLITNQPLIDKFVTLKCGHKFNYIPLYKDLVNHKKKFNMLEATSGKLGYNEIRCPYCRNKEEGVLPYYSDLGLKDVPGVNVPAKIEGPIYHNKRCEYLIPNLNFNPSSNNIIEIGSAHDLYNCKFYKCHHSYTSLIVPSYGDNKYYCWHHKKIVLKKYKQEAVEKLKQEKQQLKEQVKKAKEEAKQKEEEAKQKEKEEKQKVKEEKQHLKEQLKKAKDEAKQQVKKQVIEEKIKKEINTADENIVIGLLDSSDLLNCCSQILKTGTNKGSICGISVYKDNLCKRHYNLNNK
jgi:vacuolar-type H+-ATPase subunit H